MSKFEDIGIAKQYNSITITQAKYYLEKSCYICIMSGRHLLCKNCHINGAHQAVVKLLSKTE